MLGIVGRYCYLDNMAVRAVVVWCLAFCSCRGIVDVTIETPQCPHTKQTPNVAGGSCKASGITCHSRNIRNIHCPLIPSVIPYLSHSTRKLRDLYPAYCSKICHTPTSSECALELPVTHAGSAKENAMALNLVKLAVNGAMIATTNVSHDRGTILPNNHREKLVQIQGLHSKPTRLIHTGWIVGCGQTPVLRLFGGWA